MPVFFVVHGFTDNFPIVPFVSAIGLIIKYLTAAILFSLVFWLVYKNFNKANLLAFFILIFNFLYGKGTDFLKNHINNPAIGTYIFILPLTFLFFIALIIFLKKTKKNITGTVKYLNYLFLLLIFIDAGNLLLKILTKKTLPNYALADKLLLCDTCSKPDIYLIIADEYAGKIALQDKFAFDNSAFENELRTRGFHVVNNSKSNYDRTEYSIASILNMTYVDPITKTGISDIDVFHCLDMIKENNVIGFFKNNSYEIYNYSIFDLAGSSKPVSPTFIPSRESLITAQTFINNANKDHLFSFEPNREKQEALDEYLYKSIKIDSLTKKNSL